VGEKLKREEWNCGVKLGSSGFIRHFIRAPVIEHELGGRTQEDVWGEKKKTNDIEKGENDAF